MRPDAELSVQDCIGSLDKIKKARTSNVLGTAAKGVGSRHINGMNIGCADGSGRFKSSSDPLKPITTGVVETNATGGAETDAENAEDSGEDASEETQNE